MLKRHWRKQLLHIGLDINAVAVLQGTRVVLQRILSSWLSSDCRLHVPMVIPETRYLSKSVVVSSGTTMSPTEAWLNDEIVGQEGAISIIATALEGWVLDDYYHNDEDDDTKHHANHRSSSDSTTLNNYKNHRNTLTSRWLFQNYSSLVVVANRGVLCYTVKTLSTRSFIESY